MQAVIDLEQSLDTFQPHDDLNALLRLRCVVAEYIHRIAGGRGESDARLDTKHFLDALVRIVPLALEGTDIGSMQAIHAILVGTDGPTPIRETSIAMRAKIPNVRLRLTGSVPWEVLPRLGNLTEQILLSPMLGRFEKIALAYFELIRTHPFEDGNGRLARLLLTAHLEHEFQSHVFLTITHVMRTNFRRYNGMIRNQNKDVYGEWLVYLAGILMAELHAAMRCDGGLKGLDAVELREILSIVADKTEAVRCGLPVDLSLAVRSDQAISPRVARLLTGLFT